jgi:hypothetical protein
MIEFALCFRYLSLRLAVSRMLGCRNTGITAQPGELRLRLLAQRIELALIGLQSVLRLVVDGL